MKKIFFLIVLLFNFDIIFAYETTYFSVDIPEGYQIVTDINGIYKWENKDKYISITVSNNTNNYSVKDYTQSDLSNQKKYIEDKINNNLNEYDTKVSVTKINKSILKDDLYSLSYTIYWPTKEHTGYDIYQYGNVISTDDYMYTIVYNTDKDILDDEYKLILNSFTPVDVVNKVNDDNFRIFLVIIVALILSIIRLIIKYIKKKSKKKLNKKKTSFYK